jgi:hypothetical protein
MGCSCSVNEPTIVCDYCAEVQLRNIWRAQKYQLARYPIYIPNFGIDNKGNVYQYGAEAPPATVNEPWTLGDYDRELRRQKRERLARLYGADIYKEESVMNYRERYEAMAVQAAEKLAKLDALPDVSELPIGTVLYVQRKIGEKTYGYAFLLVEVPDNAYSATGALTNSRSWYQTGRVTGSWSDEDFAAHLLSWDVTEISVVSEWTQVY